MTDIGRVTNVAVGHDGELGYLSLSRDGLDDVCVRRPAGRDRRIAAESPRGLGWTPDGNPSFLSPGPVVTEDGTRYESGSGRSQLWIVDGDAGVHQRTGVAPGVLSYDWEPDGSRVVLECITSDEEASRLRRSTLRTERQYHNFTGQGWFATVGRALFVQSPGGDPTPVPDSELSGALGPVSGLQPAWGPQGIAFVTNVEGDDRSLATDVAVIDPDEPVPRRLTDDEYSVEDPRWCPTGTQLAVIRTDPTEPEEPREIAVVDYPDGSTTVVTDGFDRRVVARGLTWGGDTHLYTLVGDRGRTDLYRISIADGGVERVVDSSVEDGTLRGFGVRDGVIWCARSSVTAGEELVRMAPGVGPDQGPVESSSTGHVAEWGAPDGIELREVEWESDDGEVITGYLYTPDGPPPHELLVSVHGGPVDFAEPACSRDVVHWVSKGMAVLEPNYRGSVSFGTAFTSALRGRWNDFEVRDVLCGVNRLVDAGVAEDSRLYLTGFSHGGTVVAYVLAESDRFRAAVAGNAVFDFRAAYGTGEAPYRFEAEFGLPWRNRETYARISPVDHVEQIDTPLLLFAGCRDWHAPFTQADQFFTRLRRCGVPSRLVLDPDAGHEPQPGYLVEMADWFRRFGSDALH